jgi:O-antigen/teichoic acid export membrane protein
MLNITAAYQTYQAIRFVVMLLISVALARYIDDLSLVSEYEHWLWVANFFAFAWYMGIGKALLSYYPSVEQSQRSSLVASTWWLMQGIAAVTFAVIWYGRYEWEIWLGLPAIDYWWQAAALAALLVGSGLLEVILVLRAAPSQLLSWSVAAYAGLAVWVVYAIVVQRDIALFIDGLLLWYAVRWLYGAYLVLSRSWSISQGGAIARYSSLLVVQTLIAGGMAYVDGVIVNYSFDADQFAIWRYGAKELPVTIIFIAGISTAALPVLRSGGTKSMHDLRDRLGRLMRWLIPLVLVLMLIAPVAFVIVYGADYKLSGLLFITYLLITASRLLMPQIILQSRLDNGVQVAASVVEVVVNVFVSLLLLPHLGMVGIVVGSAVAFLTYKVILIRLLQQRHGIELSDYLPIRIYVRSVISLACTFVVSVGIYHYFL